MEKTGTSDLLAMIRNGVPMTLAHQLKLTVWLSIPSVLAQLSTFIMQYIDASMVGSLGAGASASIGLMSTTSWLFWGLCAAVATGFSVQVAHLIGSNNLKEARSVLWQSLLATQLFALLLAFAGMLLSGKLPVWLGGDASICSDSSAYFFIFSASLPFVQMNFTAGSMLRCSGNMKIPGLLNVVMCLLDVVFNFFLIFPTRSVNLLGQTFTIPGAGLGVEGAALGTALAIAVVSLLMCWYLCWRTGELAIANEKGCFKLRQRVLENAFRIGSPICLQHIVICGAQIGTTVIVAPLGIFAIAANSFGIVAESLCYMPGYGIADAATALVGQSKGAGRTDLMRRFAWIAVTGGMLVMGVMGALIYWLAPQIIGIMTPDATISELAVSALRIEAFAEPMFAASIVSYAVFVGAGSSLVPSLMNFFSIWGVRLTLAALLAPKMGLNGVWLAMCIELCFRGAIFLIRLRYANWTGSYTFRKS